MMTSTIKCDKCDKCKKEIDYPYTFILQKHKNIHLCGECTRKFNQWLNENEEYPLTFEQALREMLDGKIVMNNHDSTYVYRIHNGTFEDSNMMSYGKWEPCAIFVYEQRCEWKVVEAKR